MKKQDISALIEKYYDGTLSSKDEAILKERVTNSKDEEYNAIRRQFTVMDELSESDLILDDDFDSRVLDQITTTGDNRSNWFSIGRVLSGIAATALILISVWIALSIMGSNEVYGTINEPSIAFLETKKALQKVSNNVKKGVAPATSTIKKVDENIEKAKDLKKASKAIDNMKDINRLSSPSLLLKSMTKVTVKIGKS